MNEITRIVKLIDERLTAVRNILASGSIGSMEDYRFHYGRVTELQIMLEQAKKLGASDDDDD